MSEFEKTVFKIISEHPGIKAKDIAQLMDCDKKDVNSVLYGGLSRYCYQDSSYRWYLDTAKYTQPSNSAVVSPDKCLSNICKYYLNCLSLEESNGVSAFLTSKHSLNYTELSSLNIESSDEAVANLIHKASMEKNLTAHIGYPVMIEKFYSTKTNQDYFKVAPVFLFPVEISAGAVNAASIPHINMEVIKQYSSRDINSQVYDLIELENELGLNALDADIDFDEIIARLQAIRDWQWKEYIDPYSINITPSISTINQEGIYNKAIFILTERSPYTIGLETELSKLALLDEASYKNTALYDWVHHNTFKSVTTADNDIPLLEVLPMNSEQEQAIRHASTNKLTIVTGPPGTGKSQVVTNLLANSAWNGKSVLFTSKNNKAVDVVETRINSLGRRPIMLRIGGDQYAYRLSELISDLLASSPDQSDQQEYKHYSSLYREKVALYKRLKEKKEHIINVRNRTDHLEQEACKLRDDWDEWFEVISEEDVECFKSEFEKYCSAYEKFQNCKNSFLGKLLWFVIGNSKTIELDRCLSDLNSCFLKYKQQPIVQEVNEFDEKQHEAICAASQKIIYALQTIEEYRESLNELLLEQQPESIDRELTIIKSSLSDVAGKLWNKWLITRPIKLDAISRKEMNEYVAAMRLIGNVSLIDYPEIRKKFKNLQQKMTSFLPCWAVTSLSAKGRIPFQPGIFDLVIVDEASQCDIASVLPMLYRAKQAVIIGDPKQLNHISSISKVQDISLLQKYNVDMIWSYSASSLYSLASGLSEPSQIIQLRDHHRSFADIIEFSNTEFYENKLRVATNYNNLNCPENISAGIHWVDIVGKTVRPSFGGACNELEASAVVEEIKRIVIDNEYTGTLGVVTPFKAQADKIKSLIENNSELKNALLTNDFIVDTVHKFQGDERDLIFFSPTISHGSPQGALAFLKNTGNLFNVAITRARSVFVVVGDMNYCSKCEVAYMEHFVNYVSRIKLQQDNKDTTLEIFSPERKYPKVSNPEQVSEWEHIFYTALFDQDIKSIPQYSVDKYKLDFAIIDDKRMLDIEIDGEMYHKDWTGELCYRDQLRNQRLFELGWDVKRFWVYQIRDDLQGCINQIKDWLNNK